MKRLFVSVVVVGAFIVYSFIHGRTSPVSHSALVLTTSRTSSRAASGAMTTTSAPPGSRYKDGAYTGSVADAQWGYVQVKAIVRGGKLADVQWLRCPRERERSIEANARADPQLTSEAIQAQSAQVDIVTGATDSSVAFMQSLADALTQAQG